MHKSKTIIAQYPPSEFSVRGRHYYTCSEHAWNGMTKQALVDHIYDAHPGLAYVPTPERIADAVSRA